MWQRLVFQHHPCRVDADGPGAQVRLRSLIDIIVSQILFFRRKSDRARRRMRWMAERIKTAITDRCHCNNRCEHSTASFFGFCGVGTKGRKVKPHKNDFPSASLYIFVLAGKRGKSGRGIMLQPGFTRS